MSQQYFKDYEESMNLRKGDRHLRLLKDFDYHLVFYYLVQQKLALQIANFLKALEVQFVSITLSHAR